MKILCVCETERHGFAMKVKSSDGIVIHMPISLEVFMGLVRMGVKIGDYV